MPCSDSCHKLKDDHAKNHYEDNRKHKLKQHKHIAHLFFIFRPMITLSTKHTTITKSEAAIYSNASVYHGAEYDSIASAIFCFNLLASANWELFISSFSVLGLAVHHTLHETSLSKIPYYQLHLPTTSLLLPHRVIHTELSAYN